MEKKSFGFPQPKFMTKKSTPEKINGSVLPFTTNVVSSLPSKPSHPETLKSSVEIEQLSSQEPGFNSHFSSVFQRPFNSPTVAGENQSFSPLHVAAEFPFTPRRKPTKAVVTKAGFPVTPVKTPSPRAPSEPASLTSSNEIEEPLIHRPQSRASLPSFFRRPFSTLSSECMFTPKRNKIKAEMSHEDPSSISSPINFDEGNIRRFRKQSLFRERPFSRVASVNAEQPTSETDEQQGEDENFAAKAVNISDHPGFFQYQFSETMDAEKPYFEEVGRKTDTNRVNSTISGERKISFESKLQAFTGQLLAAAEEAQSNVKAENASLKKELSRSQKHIVSLEAQFDQLEKKQSEAIKSANHLSLEKETLRDRLRNLEEQMSAVQEELEKKQGHCEEMNLQLADKEQRLKVALDNITSLEELTRSSDGRVRDLQAELQLVLTDRIAAYEKIATMSEQVDSLHENLVSLESAMSNAENKFNSTLNDCKDQQEKLQKEITYYQDTESALHEALVENNTVKGELKSCIEELSKTKEDSKSILEENLKLEERLDHLNEKYATCEQSSGIARENICSLEKVVSSLQTGIQQLDHRLEFSTAELFNSREEETKLRKENETLRCQLNSCQSHLSVNEDKFLLELTRAQQELNCERAAHSETKKSAMAVFNETRNILETHINELQGNSAVAELENDSTKREGDGERTSLGEDDLCWEFREDQLETYFHLLSAKLYKVKSTMQALNDEINSRKCQVNELQEKIIVHEGQIESTGQELQSERAAHVETKSSWKQCKDQLKNERNEHSINLLKVENALQVLSNHKSSLEAQVGNLEGNLIAAERQNETIKQELCSERDAHCETKTNWKFCKEKLGDDQHQHSVDLSRFQSAMQIMSNQKKFVDDQINDLQNKLAMTGRNHESIREKNISLERQLEFSAIEISTLRAEVRDHSNRNHEIQALLDDVRMKSALSEDSLKAALSNCRRELDSHQEIQRETMRNLTETNFKLRSMEDIRDQALVDRTKLQSDVARLTKEKLEYEETEKRLEIKITTQEKKIDSVTACNGSLNQTLGVYEDYMKATHQKCQIMFAENSEAAINAKELAAEIKTLNENFQIIQKNAEIVDEDLMNFNVSFGKLVETKTVFSTEIQNRLAITNSLLASSNEALQKSAAENSLLKNAIHVAAAEKVELEKQIEIARENSLASEAIQEQLCKRNAILEEMKTSSDQQIVDLQERVRSVGAELILSSEKIRDLQNDKLVLETQLESLHHQLQAAQYTCENAVGVLITEKEQLEEKVRTITESAANWKSTNEKFCTRNSALKSSLISSGQQISDLHQRINSLDIELTLSKEKVKDLAVEKTNLESQLGSLRHQLKESREKFNRDLEKLRHQLDSEKASHENFKLRLSVIPTSPQQSLKLINVRKQKGLKLELLGQTVVELNKKLVDENKNSSGPKNEVPAPPLTITKEKFNSHSLSEYRHQFETGKGSHKNKVIFGSPSNTSSPTNCSADTLNNSSKIKNDKRDCKIITKSEENKPVTIIEESPPAAARKTRPRRAALAANRSFPIQLDSEQSPSSSGGTEQRKTQTLDEITVSRERRKLVLTQSPSHSVLSHSPIQNSVYKATPSKCEQEEVSDFDVNESLATKTFAPARKTYARKRLSMTARLVSANTVSAQPPKKPRRATK